MSQSAAPKKLSIFVHRASECLTDHESHGDGLICFSLLNGLAERGHHIYAYTNRAPIRACHPNLVVKTDKHLVPANSLAQWEYSWRAERWMRQLARDRRIDLVWRMHPYGAGLPYPPQTGGRPLVIGPMFYGWPNVKENRTKLAQPRLGISLLPLVRPFARKGWEQALHNASLLICSTEPQANAMRHRVPRANVLTLPVIVEPPAGSGTPRMRCGDGTGLNLMFVANLVTYKHPLEFCKTIQLMRGQGLAVTGTLLGDGPERASLQSYCQDSRLQSAICFAGKVPNSEVYYQLQKADALVSMSYREPYGRGIVEAMSVGTPVICHRSGGPADFIEDGVDGLLVDELTVEAYSSTVFRLDSTPGLWDTLSRNAIRKSEQWRGEIVLSQLERALLDVWEAS